jgi:hypothetical protein
VLVSAVIASLLLFSGWPAVARAEGSVTVSPSRILPGETVTVAGSGWAPHDQILVSFTDPSGNVLPLGVIAADAAGNFRQVVPVPATVAPGTYQIDGNGVGGSVSVLLTILQPARLPAPATPTPRPPTATPRPGEPTDTPPPSATATATSSPTATVTLTPTPSATATATFTPTVTPTSTPTPTNTPSVPERIVQTGEGAGPLGAAALLVLLGTAGFLAARRLGRI